VATGVFIFLQWDEKIEKEEGKRGKRGKRGKGGRNGVNVRHLAPETK
jgi:hypothetical protein